ncbi:MAG: glycosyltransferase family 4 protein [Candidatus Woesearchaeota archaeon]
MGEKIALLTPTFCHYSGIDRVVELQAKEFAKKGHKVTIFCLEASIKSKYAKVVEIGMPKSQIFERIYRLFMFLDFIKINKFSKMLKDYDIVISHFYPMNLIAKRAKKKYNIKYIYRDYGIASSNLFNFYEALYLKFFKILVYNSVNNADEVVSISNYLSKVFYEESQIKPKVEYIPIDNNRFNKNVKVNSKIKNKYKYIKGPIFLYVGRISPHKGIHLLIKVFNNIKQKLPDSYLLVIGKPTFNSYFKKLKKMSNKNIKFIGFVDDKDLPSYYALCDVYTTCTLWEGYDMPIAEAQACGKPVVCFDIGPHKEVLKNGKLVKVKDVLDISEKEICDFADKVRVVL